MFNSRATVQKEGESRSNMEEITNWDYHDTRNQATLQIKSYELKTIVSLSFNMFPYRFYNSFYQGY